MAAAFRSLLAPGDGVVVMQPIRSCTRRRRRFFGLVPRFVTLREDRRTETWRLDRDELRAALADPAVKAVVVNTPRTRPARCRTRRTWDSSRNSAGHTPYRSWPASR